MYDGSGVTHKFCFGGVYIGKDGVEFDFPHFHDPLWQRLSQLWNDKYSGEHCVLNISWSDPNYQRHGNIQDGFLGMIGVVERREMTQEGYEYLLGLPEDTMITFFETRGFDKYFKIRIPKLLSRE